jgi:hypothetical protein
LPYEICKYFSISQSDQTIEKIRPIFGNEAKTVAKISKLTMKVQNSSSKGLNKYNKLCSETAYLCENI